MKTFKRKRKGSMIAGICSGLSEYTDVDALLFRFLFIFASPSLFIYLLIWLLTEEE